MTKDLSFRPSGAPCHFDRATLLVIPSEAKESLLSFRPSGFLLSFRPSEVSLSFRPSEAPCHFDRAASSCHFDRAKSHCPFDRAKSHCPFDRAKSHCHFDRAKLLVISTERSERRNLPGVPPNSSVFRQTAARESSFCALSRGLRCATGRNRPMAHVKRSCRAF